MMYLGIAQGSGIGKRPWQDERLLTQQPQGLKRRSTCLPGVQNVAQLQGSHDKEMQQKGLLRLAWTVLQLLVRLGLRLQ